MHGTQRPPLLDHLRVALQGPARRHRVPARTRSWLACFTAISAVLVLRNAYLFTTRIYEDADFAANSIAVLQAKRFELLTGNYSRLGFYHPGPVFLYVEAWGEWLFHDVAHLVPTPWNGQLLAILLLNAALLAAVISVFARHGGTLVAVGCLGAILAFTVLHPLTANSNWMPYVYFAPAVLMLVSAAAVAAGQTTAVPLLFLAAGLCVHGEAEFLFFAPIVVLTALGGLFAPHWRSPLEVFRAAPRHWLGALAVTLALALPIVVNTVLHWPGEWPRYVDYGTRAGHVLHHTPGTAAGYLLRFWWPGGPARAVHLPEQVGAAVCGVGLAVLAFWLARICPDPGRRRFLLWSWVMAIAMTVLFAYYAWRAIDELFTAYEGYFYWSAPLLMLLAAVAGGTAQIPPAAARLAVLLLAGVTLAFAVAAAVVPLPPDDPHGPGQYFGDPGLPHAAAVLRAASKGHEIVLDVYPEGTWIDAVGVIAYADRTGLRACVRPEDWVITILFRAQSICTPAEARDGTTFAFVEPQHRLPGRPLLIMKMSLVFRLK